MEINQSKEQNFIPESERNLSLKEALKETLEKTKGLDLFLTGGTASAVYGGEQRPLSLDLDFFVKAEHREAIKKRFNGEFVFFADKKLFKSNKLVGRSANSVDLDFIETQNIVPDENHFEQKIVFQITPLVEENSIDSDFMGEKVKVMPPECVVIAKLFAGRGENLGKYDLKDSNSILETGIVRPDVFAKFMLELSAGKTEVLDLIKTRLSEALARLPERIEVLKIKQVVANVFLEDLQNGTDSVKNKISQVLQV